MEPKGYITGTNGCMNGLHAERCKCLKKEQPVKGVDVREMNECNPIDAFK